MAGFSVGTLVQTKTGLRSIQELRVGDLVYTQSDNQEFCATAIKKVIILEEQELWALTYFHPIPVDGIFNKEIVLATSDQLIWVSQYEDDIGETHKVDGWLRVDQLYQCEAKGLLHNQQVIGLTANPVLATPNPSLGYIVEELEWNPQYLCEITNTQTVLFGVKHLTGGLALRYDVAKGRVPYNKERIKIAQLDDEPVIEFLAYYQNTRLMGYEHRFKACTYQLILEQGDSYFVQSQGIRVHQ